MDVGSLIALTLEASSGCIMMPALQQSASISPACDWYRRQRRTACDSRIRLRTWTHMHIQLFSYCGLVACALSERRCRLPDAAEVEQVTLDKLRRRACAGGADGVQRGIRPGRAPAHQEDRGAFACDG